MSTHRRRHTFSSPHSAGKTHQILYAWWYTQTTLSLAQDDAERHSQRNSNGRISWILFDIWFDSYITGLLTDPYYNKALTNHRVRRLRPSRQFANYYCRYWASAGGHVLQERVRLWLITTNERLQLLSKGELPIYRWICAEDDGRNVTRQPTRPAQNIENNYDSSSHSAALTD